MDGFTITLLMGLAIGIALVVIIFGLSSLERYRRLWRILSVMGSSAVCFAYGLGVVFPIAVFYFVITTLIDTFGTGWFRFDWIAYAALGYFVISGIGYVVKRALARAKDLHAGAFPNNSVQATLGENDDGNQVSPGE